MFVIYGSLGCLLVLLASLRQSDRYPDACVAVGLVVLSVVGSLVSVGTTFLHSTYDNYLYWADTALGLDPAPLMKFIYAHWLSRDLILNVYWGLPFAFALSWVWERSSRMVRVALIATALSPIFYILVPAVGPIHAFPGYPFVEPHVSLRMLVLPADLPRNAFPSLHFAWALILWRSARARPARIFYAAFAMLTALATVATGEHYVIDLIASIPFVVLVTQIEYHLQKRGKNHETFVIDPAVAKSLGCDRG